MQYLLYLSVNNKHNITLLYFSFQIYSFTILQPVP